MPHRAPVNSTAIGISEDRCNAPETTKQPRNRFGEPSELIQHLASHNQLLACLKWLGEFQVLACIPLSGSISAKEVSELAQVPEALLCRVYRMTTTFGFLQEPQSGHVAHTSLSAPFVTDLSFLDAVMFLAETAAPTALQMTVVTNRQEHVNTSSNSAYSAAFGTTQPFQETCMAQARMQRQWSAYRQCTEATADAATEWMRRLNWRSLGNACIVDVGLLSALVCAPSIEAASALAELHPQLRVVVQISEPSQLNTTNNGLEEPLNGNSRITVQRRTPGVAQIVKDAKVYILRLTTLSSSLSAQIRAELEAHLAVLHANSQATIILAPPLLPEPATIGPEDETLVRLYDLYHLQLSNESKLELEELMKVVNSVYDDEGRLVIAHKLRSCNGALVAVGISYEAKSML
ncbi:MAG: hypothetical protein M1828_005951 [Chrysothrix sp. TS-e1954]|nr:MAG: hypothetical protein M1828_005951 [Chrysothrix sp. TS-e1954]